MGRYDGDTGLFSASEFVNRGVIKLAPDAIVYLNMSDNPVYLSPISGITQNTKLQDGITSINIQNNVDPPGSSSCTIEITTPIYSEKSYYWVKVRDPNSGKISLKPRFTTMMEVKVWFKGRFLVGNSSQYYPAFWGFITSVEESFSGGMYKMQLQCGDMLHMWQFVETAYRPSIESSMYTQMAQGLTIYGSRYNTDNPFQIIWTLCQQMGFENFITPGWIGKLNTNGGSAYPDPRYKTIFQEAYTYWNNRFAGQQGGNLLKMYGASGQLIYDPRKAANKPSNKPNQVSSDSHSVDKSKLSVDKKAVEPFDIDKRLFDYQIFNIWADMKNLSEAEYKTKLEIATDIKTKIEFEFFQDVDGNFIFKPPFYNMNTKALLPYNIKPQDIINFSATTNSDEIITAMEVQCSVIDQIATGAGGITNNGFYMDINLAKNYGYRLKQVNSQYLSSSNIARSYACGELSLTNAKAYTASVTIPGRPELRLGYPVYIDHKDAFYYVKAINHSFDFGGTFTTTLSLEAKREKVFNDDGNKVLKNYMYKYVEQTNTKNPQGAYLKAEENIFNEMRHIQQDKALQTKYDENAAIANAKANALASRDGKPAPKSIAPQTVTNRHVYSTDPQIAYQQLLLDTGIDSSLRDGVYEIVPMKNANGQLDSSLMVVTNTTVPYTDDEGYNVIGAFKYGRGTKVYPGSALDEDENFNTANANRVAKQIASMTSSIDEGNIMGDYFKANNQAGIEAGIVQYTTIPIPVVTQSPETAANLQVNAKSGGTSSPASCQLVGSVNITNVG